MHLLLPINKIDGTAHTVVPYHRNSSSFSWFSVWKRPCRETFYCALLTPSLVYVCLSTRLVLQLYGLENYMYELQSKKRKEEFPALFRTKSSCLIAWIIYSGSRFECFCPSLSHSIRTSLSVCIVGSVVLVMVASLFFDAVVVEIVVVVHYRVSQGKFSVHSPFSHAASTT